MINSNDYYAVDGGAIIELATGTKKGEAFKKKLKEHEIYAFTHQLAITELSYILCRRYGREKSDVRVKQILESSYFTVVDTERLIKKASYFKCRYSIALADCFTLALAEEYGFKALFAKKEAEILRELEIDEAEMKIEFLADW